MGRDVHAGCRIGPVRRFNSRARMGRDARGLATATTRSVSIHAPAWGATGLCAAGGEALAFQFTRPHGARPKTAFHTSFWSSFQFTRPHGARHGVDLLLLEADVSIHAPAWGATLGRRNASFQGRVSIHAPAWGATPGRHVPPPLRRVSIHAPAWGATRGHVEIRLALPVSIHAPAWGATREQIVDEPHLSVSIHAPAWGATSSFSALAISSCFNSRARMGRDGVIIAQCVFAG